jgi:hypothetical protein
MHLCKYVEYGSENVRILSADERSLKWTPNVPQYTPNPQPESKFNPQSYPFTLCHETGIQVQLACEKCIQDGKIAQCIHVQTPDPCV